MLARRHPAAALLALALALPAPPARAENAAGGLPGEWLARYAGARTLGMGGAFSATADDALGVLWNPAGLSFMDQNQLMFENVRLFEDSGMNAFGFAVPGSRFPSLGLAIVSLGSGEFQRTNDMNDPLGTFRQGETAYLLTAARNVNPRLALGANLKLVQQTVEDHSGGGFGVDAGALLQVTPALRLGIAAFNLGGPSVSLRDTPEDWPLTVRGGAAVALLGGRALVALQVDHADGPGARLHAGTEYWIQPGLALRVGADGGAGTGGFSYRFSPDYRLDYAATDHPLGISHRVGLSYRFGGFFASSAAEPTVFSPTGERAVTRIHLKARTKGTPERWTVEIVDKQDQIVRRFGGEGQPPSHLQWDGKDETGLPLPDGAYRYALVVRDREGRVVSSASRAVEIATGGPSGSVPMVSGQ